MTGRRLWVAVAWALVAVGCSDQGPEEELLAQVHSARTRWLAQRPARYVYGLERICSGCTAADQGPVDVTVDRATPVAWRYAGDGPAVPGEIAALFPSVDGLLDLIEDAIRTGAYEVSAQYDAGTGVPLVVRIDYEPFVFDEERYYRVVRLPRAEGT